MWAHITMSIPKVMVEPTAPEAFQVRQYMCTLKCMQNRFLVQVAIEADQWVLGLSHQGCLDQDLPGQLVEAHPGPGLHTLVQGKDF